MCMYILDVNRIKQFCIKSKYKLVRALLAERLPPM